MRICIFGAGVIGSVFAGRLAQAGHDVTVIARGSRLEELKSKGVVLVDVGTRKKECVSVEAIESLPAERPFDYVLVTVQRTQVETVLPELAANCSRNIVFVVNTAGGYAHWAEAVGEARILIGFPSAGGERKDGEIRYFIGRGLQRLFQTTTFGELDGSRSKRVTALIRLFVEARIPSVFCKDMDAWQKTHVALVTSIANALYGHRCDNYQLGRSPDDVRRMVLGIKEGRQVLRMNGIRPTPSKLGWLEFPTSVLTLGFCCLMRTRLAETTMAKHCVVARQEMRLLQQEFDVLIERSGIETPTIQLLKRSCIDLE